MGIYDRDYDRPAYGDGYGQQPGVQLGVPQSMTVRLVIVTVIVFVAQLVFRGNNPGVMSWFDSLFALHAQWFLQPWRVFELLSYGFMHDSWNMWHIVGNMFVLWMFGRHVEQRLGGREFLMFYLVAIVFAGITWDLTELMLAGRESRMLGASGGVSAVLLLFIFYYPRVTILFMFIFPMPAWVLGVIIIATDLFGAVGRGGEVAFTAHLGGFLFAYLYHKFGWRLTSFLPTSFQLPSFERKPPLRVHRPPADEEDKTEKRLNELLDKVHVGGQDSLTASESRELQKLSKHYQNKRR